MTEMSIKKQKSKGPPGRRFSKGERFHSGFSLGTFNPKRRQNWVILSRNLLEKSLPIKVEQILSHQKLRLDVV